MPGTLRTNSVARRAPLAWVRGISTARRCARSAATREASRSARPRAASDELAQPGDVGRRRPPAVGELGARRQQLVALLFGGDGSQSRLLVLGLDGFQPAPGRLGTVLGVAHLRPQLRDRLAQRGDRRLVLGAAATLCFQLGVAFRQPPRQRVDLASGAHGALLRRRSATLLARQGALGVALGAVLVEALHECGDSLLPSRLTTQPLEADIVDGGRRGGDGEPRAEVLVGVDDATQRPQRRRRQRASRENALISGGMGTGGFCFCQRSALRTANSRADRRRSWPRFGGPGVATCGTVRG